MRALSFLAFLALLFMLPDILPASSGIKHIGTPLIREYKRSDFKAGRQTWMIEQGSNGMMYFANNDGLLEFDGKEWNLYQLPNRTIVRCIKSDGQGRIYAGGFNEMGYFSADEQGRMSFHSLTDLMPEGMKDFGEIWKIHLTPSGIIFQSFSAIIIIRDSQVDIIETTGQFHFSYYVRGELYVVDRQEGLMRLALDKLFPVVGTEFLKGKEIWGILPFNDKILIATAGDGVFLYDGSGLETWEEKISERLSEEKIFCVARVGQESIAFGTIQNGLVITDLRGKIIQAINQDQGLQNNTVLSMNTDDFGNLWLGLDNGIDYLEINSPLSTLSYQHGLNSGYAAVIHNDVLYLGTNQGVYATGWTEYLTNQNAGITFRLLENTSGQVWTLQVIEGQLFCGHNNGTYLIDGYRAVSISDISGGWRYLQMKDDPDKVVAGTYSGFIVFERVNGKWSFSHEIKGFSESSRDFFQDNAGDIWMSHGFKGIFRVRFNERLDSVTTVEFFNSANGLPSDFGMTLFQFRDSVYIATDRGIYHFDGSRQLFRQSASLSKILGDHYYRKITMDSRGNIWYFMDSRSGVFRVQEDGSYLEITLPFEPVSNSFLGGFQFVYPHDGRNVFFGSENGFIHYDPAFFKDYTKSIHAFIRSMVITTSDSVLFRGITEGDYVISSEVPYRNNSLQFFFSANDFENPDRISYSTFLIGHDEDWSGWGTQSNREFTNLHEGDYTFQVKARNIYNVESKPVSISFTVRPPWRRSLVAYLLYGLLVLLGAFAGFILIRRKINRSRREAEISKERQFRQREEELKRASLEAEKEVIRLKNEKLEEEMLLKDKELANSTLQMIQKNKFLVSLKEDLKKVISMSQDQEFKSTIRNLLKKINKDIDTESQWKVFETHFEKVHEEFLQRLKAQYPDLTPREMKLCAYLRLNISSKEIALLMNISTRGVEISRYRLRKKLNLGHDTNLTDFIISF
jgi:ligand-binding sensor domain-containing protein/DNA-binding CsgD family transcriptional regulator